MESLNLITLKFQSTLPARGATFWKFSMIADADDFNPRSPHGERLRQFQSIENRFIISIHAPRTGSDSLRRTAHASMCRFQSTLPARGATLFLATISATSSNFNPRSPHGERRFRGGAHLTAWGISIHAPRTGSDRRLRSSATRVDSISIHAPRTGSDRLVASRCCKATRFQSTLPARGATQRKRASGAGFDISIHAPRTGSDLD